MLPHPVPEQPEQQQVAIRVWLLRLLVPVAFLAWIALVVVIAWLASHLIVTILLLIVASLFAYAITPAVSLLKRIMPRPLAIVIVYVVGVGLLGLLLYYVISTTVSQVIALAENIAALLQPAQNGQPSPLVSLLERFGLTQSQVNSMIQQATTQLEHVAATFAGGLLPLLSGIAASLVNILLAIVLSIYLLADGGRVTRWLRQGTPGPLRGRIVFALDVLERVFGGYIRGQVILSSVIGLLVGVGMAILRVPYPVLLGVLSFVLEFIPVLGTILSGVICVLIALTQGWLTALLVLLYFIGVHILEGYVLAPRLLGRAVGIHPVISLLALTAGAELFGPWGAVFASPVAGLLQVIIVTVWREWRKEHYGPEPVDKPEEKVAR